MVNGALDPLLDPAGWEVTGGITMRVHREDPNGWFPADRGPFITVEYDPAGQSVSIPRAVFGVMGRALLHAHEHGDGWPLCSG